MRVPPFIGAVDDATSGEPPRSSAQMASRIAATRAAKQQLPQVFTSMIAAQRMFTDCFQCNAPATRIRLFAGSRSDQAYYFAAVKR